MDNYSKGLKGIAIRKHAEVKGAKPIVQETTMNGYMSPNIYPRTRVQFELFELFELFS